MSEMSLSSQSSSPLRKSHFQKIKKHWELIAALFSGLLILIGWIVSVSFHTTPWYLFLSAYIIGGYAKAKEGYEDTIKNRELNVELLMILAAVGASFIGHWFEGAVLIFIFSLSGALETYATDKSSKALLSLMALQPETARLISDGKEQIIPVERLNPGDIIRIKPGERVPADGCIKTGSTSLDESAMTGESVPLYKSENDEVMAGTVNISGTITVTVTKKNDETLFHKILSLVQNAQSEKAPSQVFIEQFERHYVKIVLACVALMIILPPFLFNWSWSNTIYRAMVLLVVASPCALVASTTPAVLSAIAFGARKGILIKGGVHLEQLSHIKAIAFDKTGTLTNGHPEVIQLVQNRSLEDTEWLLAVAAIENESTHPLSEAIVQFVKEQTHCPLPEASHVETKPGLGVEGVVNNKRYIIGKPGYVNEEAVKQFIKEQRIEQLDGKTHVFVECHGHIAGMFSLKDKIRSTSQSAIHQLQQLGIETIMLTGDNQETAKAIAKEAGVSQFIADCLPENKVNELKKLQRRFKSVAMVGDGINDTPAMAASTVSIAMGGGTDAALETSDIVLVKNDLLRIAEIVRLSKKMDRIIKQNMIFAIAMILVLIAGNFFQILSLPIGVIGHEGSTILVILNGLRLLKG
ncbi:Cd2+/Zn2+-exporting ATPase [Scopulibacillus daqui]|uniref:Cd2+/Zn2+-exporting ATPase n=1 Tax=Scopulibacillus daqui TaxID=1469162 RepID=A0ABS2PZ82_9BACL|nr:heavy metal translocating P-type ATPase [Scopulibacillus daqui]MBM7645186.1 Cd2+/Zn2+-exporting ATPase [Scopulibacillus daqui]